MACETVLDHLIFATAASKMCGSVWQVVMCMLAKLWQHWKHCCNNEGHCFSVRGQRHLDETCTRGCAETDPNGLKVLHLNKERHTRWMKITVGRADASKCGNVFRAHRKHKAMQMIWSNMMLTYAHNNICNARSLRRRGKVVVIFKFSIPYLHGHRASEPFYSWKRKWSII